MRHGPTKSRGQGGQIRLRALLPALELIAHHHEGLAIHLEPRARTPPHTLFIYSPGRASRRLRPLLHVALCESRQVRDQVWQLEAELVRISQ